MVNSCIIPGCRRNSKTHSQLQFYSLPKDKNRYMQWLQVASREDLLKLSEKTLLSKRICSIHFKPSMIKNKLLSSTAVPALYISGNLNSDTKHVTHKGIACNSCEKKISGFRYKCVTCSDYDLCCKCEMAGLHSEHYMIRIPKPLEFTTEENLVTKVKKSINKLHTDLDCDSEDISQTDFVTSDDEPITSYLKRKKNKQIDLPKEVKRQIRKEISRVLMKSKLVTNIENEDFNNSTINTVQEFARVDIEDTFTKNEDLDREILTQSAVLSEELSEFLIKKV